MTANYINGNANLALTTTTAVVNVSTGVQDNDLLLMFVVATGGTGVTITLPGGWTSLQNITDGVNMRCVLAWRMASSEPSNYSSTLSTTVTAAGGVMVAVRGVDLVAPIENSSSQVNASSTSVAAAAVTANTDGDWIQFFAVGTTASPTYTPPSGMTERVDASGTEAADKVQPAAGSTGSQTATASVAVRSIAMLCAVKVRQAWYLPMMGVG